MKPVRAAREGEQGFDRSPSAAKTFRRSDDTRHVLLDVSLLSGLLLLSLQCTQVGGAQLNQFWSLIVFALLLATRSVHVMGREVLAYLFFLGVAIWLTFFAGYPHMKEV